MSVKEINKIDAIGIDKNSGDVIISIIDDEDWVNEALHLFLLGEKVQAYLSFLEGDDICNTYPEAGGRQISLKIYAKHPLPAKGRVLIDNLAALVFEQGYRLLHMVYA